MLILAVLVRGPSHGYAIARAVERESENALHLREGSLYPALRALEQQGLIRSEWELQESGPARKVYALTQAGSVEFTKRADEWSLYAAAVAALLGKRSTSFG